ncbi:uncharacterized protein N7515_004411 [Penicillium bovifimosum]|uniref:Uncharacterized protein n=1 Tax=Penicillium bovifimosum TaxID=126998 RepID=A0A9W9H0F7_9EURO|nr:uncharacterized protein N7515_004411 [Penicillium bovifimosum]KAJ5135133.1 hypothetical protein N7515_004411 [Penicillium bovifimosum]
MLVEGAAADKWRKDLINYSLHRSITNNRFPSQNLKPPKRQRRKARSARPHVRRPGSSGRKGNRGSGFKQSQFKKDVNQYYSTVEIRKPFGVTDGLQRVNEETVNASLRWSKFVTDHELASRDIHYEKVLLGDEHGLQGRFQQLVGQTIGAALDAQDIGISFGDFNKGSGVAYDKVPDCALIATN